MPILTRWLSPDEYGFYIILIQIVTMLEVFGMALFSQALLRLYVEYEGKEQKEFVGSVVLSLVLVQLLVASCFYFFRHSIMLTLYPNITLALDPYIGYAAIWMVLVPLRALGISFSKIREKPSGMFLLIGIYGIFLLLSLFVLVVCANRGLQGAMESLVLADLCCLLGALMFVWRGHVILVWRSSYVRRCLIFATPLMLSSFLFILSSNLDRIILSHSVPLAEIGIYGFGVMLGNTVAMVVSGFVSAYTPRILYVMKGEGDLNAGSIAQNLLRSSITLIALAVGFLYVGNDVLVYVLGRGADFQAASLVVAGIATGHLVRSVFLFAQNGLFYKERTKTILFLNLVLLVICFGLTTAMARWVGIHGVAYVVALSYMIMLPVGYMLVRNHFPVKFPFGVAMKAACVIFLLLIGELAIERIDRNVYLTSFWVIKTVEITLLLIFFGKDALPTLKQWIKKT